MISGTKQRAKADLISSKLSAGRPIDLEDVKMLTIDHDKPG